MVFPSGQYFKINPLCCKIMSHIFARRDIPVLYFELNYKPHTVCCFISFIVLNLGLVPLNCLSITTHFLFSLRKRLRWVGVSMETVHLVEDVKAPALSDVTQLQDNLITLDL